MNLRSQRLNSSSGYRESIATPAWGLLTLLLAVALALSSCSSAGGGTEGTYGRTFSGTVKDLEGQGVPDVVVELLETGTTTLTSGAGAFVLERVELGDSSVTFKLNGPELDATVPLNQELPADEVAVEVSIRVVRDTEARVEEVRVERKPTPTSRPEPTSVPGATATPAPTNAPPPPIPTTAPTSPGGGGTPEPTPPPGATSTPEPTVTDVPTSTPSPTATPDPVTCEDVDYDHNHVIDLSDLSALLTHVGSSQGEANYSAEFDLDSDGDIDNADKDILLTFFGLPCP